MYELVYSTKAEEDLAKLRHSEPAAYKKAVKLLNELMQHPQTGTGHPEQLKGDRTGQWSRTITKKAQIDLRNLRDRSLRRCTLCLRTL